VIALDHIAIAGETLGEAIDFVETALGVSLQPGGAHSVFNTHNALLGLEDGLYLEAIAANPDAPPPERPRVFDLDRFAGPPRLTNWICRTDDLATALAAGPEGLGQPVALARGDFRWDMAVPLSGILPFDNCAPTLIQWRCRTHPADILRASGVRLSTLVVRHPEARRLRDTLKRVLHDPRVRFETGPAQLVAHFDTPSGPREIGG
jgi:hypothetical protein